MSFKAFNLESFSELSGIVSDFSNGTAYTSFDRSTFSYRYETESKVIVKQKERSAVKAKPKSKRKKSQDRKRVRWSEVRKRCVSFFNLKSSQKHCTFITISFPCGLSDENCRSALNVWLTRVRQIRPKFPYLWVAEKQKNGTLHFHLITNVWLPVRIVNRFMAIAIDGFKKDQPQVFLKWNRRIYNGVDIKFVRNQGKLKGYLTKYMTKNETPIDGSPWHCSRLFSNLATTMCFHPADILGFILSLAKNKSFDIMQIRAISTEHSLTLLLPNQIPKKWLNPLLQLNEQIEKKILNGQSLADIAGDVGMPAPSISTITPKLAQSKQVSGQKSLQF